MNSPKLCPIIRNALNKLLIVNVSDTQKVQVELILYNTEITVADPVNNGQGPFTGVSGNLEYCERSIL